MQRIWWSAFVLAGILMAFLLVGANYIFEQGNVLLGPKNSLADSPSTIKSSGGYPDSPEGPDDPGRPVESTGLPRTAPLCIPVRTPQDLDNVRNNLVGNYCQMNDIDLDGYNMNPIGAYFDPDDPRNREFIGNYTGNNYKIKNFEYLNLTRDPVYGASAVGLFSFSSGLIKGVGLENINVGGYRETGALVGNNRGQVIDVSAHEIITFSNMSSGGLIGVNSGRIIKSSVYLTLASGYVVGGLVGTNVRGTIEDSYAIGEVNHSMIYLDSGCVGGLVGVNGDSSIIRNSFAIANVSSYTVGGGLACTSYDSAIINSSFRGKVSGTRIVGGFVGSTSLLYTEGNIIENSYANSEVYGNSQVGGFVGQTQGGQIINSYADGSVVGRYNVGGFVGMSGDYSPSTIIDSYSHSSVYGISNVGGFIGYFLSGSLTNSYSKGRVTGDAGTGGLVGVQDEVNIFSSYWDINTSGQSQSAGGEGRTTQQMQTQSNYAGWDFMNIWRINERQDYPRLRWEN